MTHAERCDHLDRSAAVVMPSEETTSSCCASEGVGCGLDLGALLTCVTQLPLYDQAPPALPQLSVFLRVSPFQKSLSIEIMSPLRLTWRNQRAWILMGTKGNVIDKRLAAIKVND